MAKSASKGLSTEIDRLQKALARQNEIIERNRRDLNVISLDLGQYQRSVEQAANQVVAFQGEVALREKHAGLVAETDVAGEAIRRLAEGKEQLATLQQQLEQAQHKYTAEQTRIDRHKEKLLAEIDQAQQEVVRLNQEIADHQEMYRRSHADEGKAALAPLALEYQRLVKERDAAQARLAAVGDQLAALRTKIDLNLIEWPELVASIRQELPYEDGFVRVLACYIALIETAMRERQDLSRVSTTHSFNLFLLDRSTVSQFAGGASSPALIQKRAELQSALEQYLRKQK